MTLLDFFRRSATAHPDEVALVACGTELTYRHLDAWSATMARALRRRGAAGSAVALPAVREPWAYAAYLAILRCGRPVTPFDPARPSAHIRRVLGIAGAGVVLDDATSLPAEPDGEPEGDRPAVSEDDVAYVLFTSGSTGTPKGIPIRHRHTASFLRYSISHYAAGPGDRLSQTFGLTFDPSVFDLFVAWGSGAALVVPDRAQLLDPVRFVNEQWITHWYSVPSLVSVAHTTSTLRPGSMPSLVRSLFAGEQLTLAQAGLWADAAPTSMVENHYGPTELTVTVTGYRLPADRDHWPRTSNGTVPIGSVYPHLEHRIDPVTGELLVRGPQRFDGYLDPADNEGQFEPPAGPPVPAEHLYRTGDRVAIEDGALVHLGRLDNQVKIAGQRVELGEIEAAVREHCGFAEVVVVAGRVLTAVYAGEPVGTAELRSRLRAHLPTHMIPKRFVACVRLPLNANGKIDRGACATM